MRRSTLLGMLAVMVALALAAPGGASASHRQAMILQDDAKLIYSSPQSVSATLQMLKNMGVDRVRVSVVWQLLAPQPSAAKKPKFDATNPDAYPNGVWSRYDFLDRVATQDGLQVYFQPTAPAPNWATTPRKLPQGYRYAHDPNAADYGQFVQAVAKRYDGDFVAPDATGASTKVPAVRYWGIWNEPRHQGVLEHLPIGPAHLPLRPAQARLLRVRAADLAAQPQARLERVRVGVRSARPHSARRSCSSRGEARAAANVATVTGSGPAGYFTTHVQLASAGGVRISWSGLGNVVYDSRIATVS